MISFWETGEENEKNIWIFRSVIMECGRRGGVMVTVLVSGLSGSGLGYYVVILSKCLYCLHPGVLIGTSELNAGGNPSMV